MAPDRDSDVPVVAVFGREQLMFRSPLPALSGSFDPAFYRAANLWYPRDRRWMVVTEIDFWTIPESVFEKDQRVCVTHPPFDQLWAGWHDAAGTPRTPATGSGL
jgi:hypothetical protein